MKTIIAALDFSNTSEAVLNAASSLARATQSRVILLTIIQPPVITSEYAPLIDNVGEIIAAGEKAMEQRLAVAERRLEQSGITGESRQLTGSPVAHIIA